IAGIRGRTGAAPIFVSFTIGSAAETAGRRSDLPPPDSTCRLYASRATLPVTTPPQDQESCPRRMTPPNRGAILSRGDAMREGTSRDEEQARAPTAPLPPRRVVRPPSGARREIVHGRHTKSTYVRVLTTEERGGFRRHGGVLEASEAASRPHSRLGRLYSGVKAALIGVPL